MVTLHDVAREAGVSISTVSRALSEPDRVAESTRKRVAIVVDQLGYKPNRAASLLRSGRTGSIGLVVPDLENPYFASMTKGVQVRALESDTAVLVGDSDEDPRREADLVEALSQQTDGLIIGAPRGLETDLERLGGTRLVLVNAEAPNILSVSVDYVSAMELAVAHLHALGHRRIAYVGGPVGSRSDARRREGLTRAARAHTDVEIIDLGAFRPQVEGGESAADLAVGSGASAVIAFNDLVAVGLVSRLRVRGMSVPEGMSVVGCDDTLVATLVRPPLTTIRVDMRGVGHAAVDLLRSTNTAGRASTHEDEAHIAHVMPVELVVRGSTAVAPGV